MLPTLKELSVKTTPHMSRNTNKLLAMLMMTTAVFTARADDFPIVSNNLPTAVEKLQRSGEGNQEGSRALALVQTFIKKDGVWQRDDKFDFEPVWKQAEAGKFANCEIEENTLAKGIVHKAGLEIFVAPMRVPTSAPLQLRIASELGDFGEKIQLTQRDGCLKLKDDELQPASGGLPATHFQFELSQGADKLLDFKVPEQNLAYLVVRYQEGAMLPVPFFIDTVLFDTDESGVYSKVHLILRAQFPIVPNVRKVDVQSFYPEQFATTKSTKEQDDSKQESKKESNGDSNADKNSEKNIERLAAAKRYFKRCPYHDEQPYSKCASSNRTNLQELINEDYFTMLGMERKK